ncbi:MULTISPECIES: NADP-dependent malic enzyme [Capnocytophaga]|jgi:NADP-dependent malic enzyme|uniref:Allosteric NADP-dependent malic enzyme n=1 Tax=Capnocytophaga granulosa TaxID=45242 RepID=A0A1H2YJW8_9FLAO|nr:MULTISPECIES: NADP-dependent malic enzyme [Capnocytophaga]RKW16514.1 MAG: NADP-dependent malic enzyme [Capnocytophaga sp.]EJU32301.1 putative phosphate acetyltransferase [Capnocytophaga sp. CM59]EPD27541.1 phosphate acetyltransferase [Capnocytophaga granulosa ATCC 51502]SDX05552.1 allosteric NADP-dependent malic enzyme [Capnocytophaga granulosa]SUX18509.1 NADP-dependent malic enzyme [Capnocytophaga granulosa]
MKDNNHKKNTDALDYHEFPQPGKIAVVPTKKHASQYDLSLAYSPGVAEPCLAIEENKNDAYRYTNKGNLVAVISNGTAVLGLGNIGADAAKPVMEGKGLLFKIFADIDVFDIEVNTTDVDAFVNTVKAIAPTFGGINLEDIKSPEAFEIERRLKEELDIPVMHDDQHGTAIISAAALKNALEIVGKDIRQIKMVVNGAGAAAISCTRLYIALGADPKNIVMCDSKGVIRKDNPNLDYLKAEFATDRDLHTLEEAMKDADVFIGLSKGNVVSPEMLLSMAKDPIVFAMANPTPEIAYDLATQTRSDIIMATGRSDTPNQVNNVLGFPFIFRGALDVRATKINEEMKLAAVHALAELAKKTVPDQVNLVYGGANLSFGKEYIIPKPFDPRLIYEVPPAIAKAAIETGVAQKPITDWDAYREQLMDRLGGSNREIRVLQERARQNPKRVVFPEADLTDVLKAAQRVYQEGIAIPVLLGPKDIIQSKMEELGFEANLQIIDPKSPEERERRHRFADIYWKKRERKGITQINARRLMRERNYFGAMLVNTGEADAMITGYSRSYPQTIRPILDLVEKEEGFQRIAATSILITKRGPLFLSDTTMNPNPSSEDLTAITLAVAEKAKMFGLDPAIALLSYSNFGSAPSESTKKLSKTVSYLHKNYPELIVDGEVQVDVALNPEKMAAMFPFSKLNGKAANVLIFPNLESANITYKIMKESEGISSIGPIILGLSKPIHITLMNASVDEMVNLTTFAVVDAQERERRK